MSSAVLTLDEQLAEAFQNLDQLAERWLELNAAGRISERIAFDQTINEAIRVTRRIEKKLRKCPTPPF